MTWWYLKAPKRRKRGSLFSTPGVTGVLRKKDLLLLWHPESGDDSAGRGRYRKFFCVNNTPSTLQQSNMASSWEIPDLMKVFMEKHRTRCREFSAISAIVPEIARLPSFSRPAGPAVMICTKENRQNRRIWGDVFGKQLWSTGDGWWCWWAYYGNYLANIFHCFPLTGKKSITIQVVTWKKQYESHWTGSTSEIPSRPSRFKKWRDPIPRHCFWT